MLTKIVVVLCNALLKSRNVAMIEHKTRIRINSFIIKNISVFQMGTSSKEKWARGYGEVTWIVCIDNPLKTNESLTFLASVLPNSPADTFITPPGSTLAQCSQVFLKRQTSLDSLVDEEKGWNNSCCSSLVSSPPPSPHCFSSSSYHMTASSPS